MVVYTLVIWAVEVAVLLPVSLWILNRLIIRSGELVVGNDELRGWLFSAQGVLYILLAGSLGLLGLVLPVTGLFQIAAAAERGTAQTARETLSRVLLALPGLLHFCLAMFAVCLLCLLPLLGGTAVIALMLHSHDLRYYMTEQPSEWRWALVAGGLWLTLWICLIAGLFLRWSYALPLWLEGTRPLFGAFQMSWVTTRRTSWRLLRRIGVCILIAVGVQFILGRILRMAAGLALRLVGDSVLGLFYTASAYSILTALVAALCTVLGMAWSVSVLLISYREQIPPRDSVDSASATLDDASNDRTSPWPLLRPGIVLVALAALLAASTVISLRLLSNDTSGVCPLIIAHRAGAGRAPENTLAALEIAIEENADWAEIDVQRTADGVVVVVHDADLLRTAGYPLRIGQTPYAMLARVDVGKPFDEAFAGERVPTLADFLERARGRIKLLIELKYHGFDPQLVAETVSLVRQYNMAEEVAIMSFQLEGVRQAQRLAPDIPIGYVASMGIGNLARLDVDFLAIAQRRARSKLIRQTQRRELPVYAWTVNDTDDMLDLMERGVGGLITDDPALAGETIKYIRTLAPPERVLLRLRHLWAPYRTEHNDSE